MGKLAKQDYMTWTEFQSTPKWITLWQLLEAKAPFFKMTPH